MHGSHCLKSWCSNQTVIATSGGEAEFHVLVKGASELFGFLSVARDLHVPFAGRLTSDSSAAIGITQRQSLVKVKHMHAQFLWVQERVSAKDFERHKGRTDRNRADLMTKYLTRPTMDKFLVMIGYRDPVVGNSLALRSQ